MGELGRILKEGREGKGLSLRDVEESTKIRKKYLQALEEEDFEKIPGRTYARGFLKNYSNFLQLETDELLREFDAMVANSFKDKDYTPVRTAQGARAKGSSKTRSQDRESKMFKIGLAILAVLIIFIGVNMFGSDGPDIGIPQTGSQTEDNNQGNQGGEPGTNDNNGGQESPEPEPEPEPEPIQGVRLEVAIIKSQCWIKVTSDGNVVFSGTLNQGDTRTFEGDSEIVITLGNAGAAKLTYNGEELPPVGGDGEVVTPPPFVAQNRIPAGSTGGTGGGVSGSQGISGTSGAAGSGTPVGPDTPTQSGA